MRGALINALAFTTLADAPAPSRTGPSAARAADAENGETELAALAMIVAVSREASPDDLVRSHQAIRMDDEYKRETLSSSEGRESTRIRRRALLLARAGRHEHAHALFLQAARLHPQTDNGAAAGSARHDVGISFSDRRLGARIENLLAAERWFRAALACPSRVRCQYHAVQTENSLGICLRRLAAEGDHSERELPYLDEAEALLRKSVTSAEAMGPVGWSLAARFSVNLGNLLLEQRKDIDAALTEYRRGLQLGKQSAEFLEVSQRTS